MVFSHATGFIQSIIHVSLRRHKAVISLDCIYSTILTHARNSVKVQTKATQQELEILCATVPSWACF